MLSEKSYTTLSLKQDNVVFLNAVMEMLRKNTRRSIKKISKINRIVDSYSFQIIAWSIIFILKASTINHSLHMPPLKPLDVPLYNRLSKKFAEVLNI